MLFTAKQLGLKDFSPKSQDAVALQQIKERGALPMIDVVRIYQAIDRCSNIWASTAGRWLWSKLEHKADSLIAKFKEAGGTVREIDMSRLPGLSPLWLSASSSACHGLHPLPDNAITYKAQRDKNARELSWRTRQLLTCRCWRCCCVDAKYTKELADAKAENDALRDDALLVVVTLTSKLACRPVRGHHYPAWIMQPPRLEHTAPNGIIFTLRERPITMQKQLEGTQKYINEQCR